MTSSVKTRFLTIFHPNIPAAKTQNQEHGRGLKFGFVFSFPDDAMGDENDEEESDAIVSQVLDELGLQLTDDLNGVAVPAGGLSVAAGQAAGKKAVAATPAGADGGNDADADLQARLDDLRRE